MSTSAHCAHRQPPLTGPLRPWGCADVPALWHPLRSTCLPACLPTWLPACLRPACRVLCCFDCRVIYVESIARVRKLSLSGTILYHTRMADTFFVQWPELQARFPRSSYAGRLY